MMKENKGFAEACDAGIRASRGQFCLLLNNDAWLADDSLKLLLQNAMITRYSFLGPAILNPDGSLQCGPMTIDLLGDPITARSGHAPFFVSGAALLLRRKDYLYLGGFDVRFFAFYEEIDLQWRAHLWNYKVGYLEGAKVYHHGGNTLAGGLLLEDESLVTSAQRLYLGRRNQLAMLLMNYDEPMLLVVIPLWLTSALVECAGAAALGHVGHLRLYASAIWWNIRYAQATLRRRRDSQALRIVSDRQIMSYFATPFIRLRTAIRLARHRTKISVR